MINWKWNNITSGGHRSVYYSPTAGRVLEDWRWSLRTSSAKPKHVVWPRWPRERAGHLFVSHCVMGVVSASGIQEVGTAPHLGWLNQPLASKAQWLDFVTVTVFPIWFPARSPRPGSDQSSMYSESLKETHVSVCKQVFLPPSHCSSHLRVSGIAQWACSLGSPWIWERKEERL